MLARCPAPGLSVLGVVAIDLEILEHSAELLLFQGRPMLSLEAVRATSVIRVVHEQRDLDPVVSIEF